MVGCVFRHRHALGLSIAYEMFTPALVAFDKTWLHFIYAVEDILTDLEEKSQIREGDHSASRKAR